MFWPHVYAEAIDFQVQQDQPNSVLPVNSTVEPIALGTQTLPMGATTTTCVVHPCSHVGLPNV